MFCNKLSLLTRKTPWNTLVTINEAADGYRLPSMNQWRWAAMGADMSPVKLSVVNGVSGVNAADKAKSFSGYNGNNNIADYAWFNETRSINGNNYGIFQAGKKKPNELGLYDMSGNVLEWCWDPHHKTEIRPSAGLQNDSQYNTYDDGKNRILMGGWVEDTVDKMSLGSWNFRESDHCITTKNSGLESTTTGTIDQGLRIITIQ